MGRFGHAVLLGLVLVLAIGTASAGSAAVAADSRSVEAVASEPAGSVLAVAPLRQELWLPGTGEAVVLTYVTQNTFGESGTSTGVVFLPEGEAPQGGWPVISWAHGTSGLGDSCAPSVMGPALPERDRDHLAKFLAQGYAIVASDYAGLGTPGLHAYLDGRTTAHNVVDMVKAGYQWASTLPAGRHLARKWVAVGQSQGGGAAIYTARYATEFGGSGLDYRGAVGTGTPAYIENLLLPIGPKLPPVALTPGLTAYLTYLFASLRFSHPELGIDDVLTDTGRKYLTMAETECVVEFEGHLKGVSIGDYFTTLLATLPNFGSTVNAYMKMPEDGFDKPFFMGHGILDTDVPYATTLLYVAALKLHSQPVTFRSYLSDHSGTLVQSERDTAPFIAKLFS
ncbi:lipase [Streptomyces sp. SID12501]|uniref:Lipase n=2 Tax=Streptomyces sp. SID12501 TaxID=2706042 RepID=A0A6B3BVZ0_9ACTN|nr:lipase [Streptomyces sp. SID12501]